MRILLIDDNKDLIDGLQPILESEGHIVDCYYEATTALHRIQEDDYDLLFIDAKLAGRNGFDIYDAYERLGKHGRVFIMTAYRVEQLIDYLLSPVQTNFIYQPATIALYQEGTHSFVNIIITDDSITLLKQLNNDDNEGYVLIDSGTNINPVPDSKHVILHGRATVMRKILTIYRLNQTSQVHQFTLIVDNDQYKQPLKEYISCGCLLKPFEPDALLDIITQTKTVVSDLESFI